VQLRSVTWVKLMDTNKKGQWWLPGVADGAGEDLASGKAEIAGVMDSGGAEADKMLQLAASQRMNTDARRSLFCIIMSAEDYLDAFEKILRLKLPGKQVLCVNRQNRLFRSYHMMLMSSMFQDIS
jgi:nucleolar MIF4G domain-containing protein 1